MHYSFRLVPALDSTHVPRPTSDSMRGRLCVSIMQTCSLGSQRQCREPFHLSKILHRLILAPWRLRRHLHQVHSKLFPQSSISRSIGRALHLSARRFHVILVFKPFLQSASDGQSASLLKIIVKGPIAVDYANLNSTEWLVDQVRSPVQLGIEPRCDTLSFLSVLFLN